MKILAALLLVVFGVFGTGYAADLRIGFLGTDHSDGCFEQTELNDIGTVAYADHIGERFLSDVILCFGEEAIASPDDPLDLVWGSQEALHGFSSAYRPFLTPRRANGLGRVPVVVFKKSSNPKNTVREFRGDRLVLSSDQPGTLNSDMPLELLQNFDLEENDLEIVFADGPIPVVQAVASDAAAFGALEATSWARTCNAYGPNHEACKGLSIIVNLRPRAQLGMIIRNDIDKEIRYRMVGVHTRLHFENEEAFRWLVGPDVSELEPTESEAFSIGLTEQP